MLEYEYIYFRQKPLRTFLITYYPKPTILNPIYRHNFLKIIDINLLLSFDGAWRRLILKESKIIYHKFSYHLFHANNSSLIDKTLVTICAYTSQVFFNESRLKLLQEHSSEASEQSRIDLYRLGIVLPFMKFRLIEIQNGIECVPGISSVSIPRIIHASPGVE